jgi:hypothetical protein
MKHAFPRLGTTLDVDSFDLVALLTAFCLLFVSADMRVFAGVTLFAVTFFPTMRRSPWFWLFLAVSWWPQLVLRWERHEDHCYLINYWCIAMGLSLMGRESYATLKQNARLLIGLTFAFGCFWKITSPDFVDGSVTLYNLLFDPRFSSGITSMLGLVADQAGNDQTAAALYQQLDTGTAYSTEIACSPLLGWLSTSMTGWTIAIEAVVAACFLLPQFSISKKIKDIALMAFTATTYFFVPVVGFGCLFCAMGAAQCEPRQRQMRATYFLLAIFVIIRANTVMV